MNSALFGLFGRRLRAKMWASGWDTAESTRLLPSQLPQRQPRYLRAFAELDSTALVKPNPSGTLPVPKGED